MKKIALVGFAALLLMGNLVAAMPADIEASAAAIFASESPACPEAPSALEPVFAQTTDFTCGSCSVPACQGSSPTTHCATAADGTKKYCQATTACTGEGILVRRCMCVVGGDIIP